MIGYFFANAFVSICIGLALGLLASLFTKNFRIFEEEPTIETIIIFIFAYSSYALTEFYEYSGIISLLICGMVMSHLLQYNFSPLGIVSS